MPSRSAVAGMLAVSSCLTASAPLLAQQQPWQVTTQPGGFQIARVVATGPANGIALTCEHSVPVIAVSLARTPTRSPAQVVLAIDGTPFPVALLRNGSTSVWVAGVRDRRLIDAMAAGSTVQVSVGGLAYGTLPLAGANAAIGTALASCHRLAATTPARPATASAAALPGGVEAGRGCPSLAPVTRWGQANTGPNYMESDSVFCGDFTGDGAPDALAFVNFAMGNSSGHEVVLFQNTGGTLRFLRRVPDVFGEPSKAVFARGKVQVDMTVMRPGDARCCPSGKERIEIDVATGRHGRIAGPRR